MKNKVSDTIFNSMSIDDRQRSLLGGAVREADLGVTVNRLPPSTLNVAGFTLHEIPFLQHAFIFALFARMYAPNKS